MNRLREARQAAGLSQRELGALAGVSRPTVIGLERNDGYEPTAATMRKLSNALNDPGLFWREEIAS